MEEGCIDVGNAKFGGQEALVVLDHVDVYKRQHLGCGRRRLGV